MPAALEKTSTPGVYRRGDRYAVIYRDSAGRQRQRSARTYDDARRLRHDLIADAHAGVREGNRRVTFRDYAAAWVERYQGRGRRGFREHTRDDYRRDLGRAFAYFGDRRVVDIGPAAVSEYVADLCRERAPGGQPLTDATVRRILAPVRACMSTAVREGVIPANPCADVALPHRPRVDDDEEDRRALTGPELEAFLELVHPDHRVLFQLLSTTGLRISEALALQWKHAHLDGSRPHVKVRRAHVRGRYGPPKSRHGRRDVPLHPDLVTGLRGARKATEWPRDDDLVFPARNGEPMRQENLRRRVMVPAAQEADVPWIGFHTFRHTTASRLFERGRNAVQVSRWLGHASPSFTMSVYTHLLDDGLGAPLDPGVSAKVSADPTVLDGSHANGAAREFAL